VRNVSRGGAFVQADLPLVIHSELAMEFALPGSDSRIAPTARVMWARGAASSCGPAGAGVRFIALDGRAAQDLDDFVHEHRAQLNGVATVTGSAA
jgi:Tfp pilus assembly protein PilZ